MRKYKKRWRKNARSSSGKAINTTLALGDSNTFLLSQGVYKNIHDILDVMEVNPKLFAIETFANRFSTIFTDDVCGTAPGSKAAAACYLPRITPGPRAVRRQRKTLRSFVFRSASAIKSNCAEEIGDVARRSSETSMRHRKMPIPSEELGCSFPAVGGPQTRNE